jgi:hypothetical protein
MRTEELRRSINSNYSIGERTRDLLCSAVSQANAPPLAPILELLMFKIIEAFGLNLIQQIFTQMSNLVSRTYTGTYLKK